MSSSRDQFSQKRGGLKKLKISIAPQFCPRDLSKSPSRSKSSCVKFLYDELVILNFTGALYDDRMTFKEESHQLIESLPDDSTWEDLMYEIYVCESIQRGLEDVRAGRTISSAEIRQRFNLPKR